MARAEPLGPRQSQTSSQAANLTVRPDKPNALYGSAARRFLTEPNRPAGNQGWDNENSDLILAVDDILVSNNGRRYFVKDVLGQGTFGQVVKCICETSGEAVAVKVIKNQTAFYHQARVEVGVLQYLNKRADADDKHHLVRMWDYFLFKNHLCLVFELLSVNLYELVKHNRFKGLSLTLLRVFITQILDALTVLKESNIIHCDLKPENVLLKSLDSGDVKVIDFGSACFENKTMYSYIQSRFYRSPEVLMGHPYSAAIDMWSLGCMAAELFLGLPLFPGASEHDLLVRVVEMMGPLPEKVLQRAQHTGKYFRKVEEAARSSATGVPATITRFYLRSQAEFEALHGQSAPAGKRYFQHTKLADIIGAYPYKSGISDEDMMKESERREAFLDFLMGVLDMDPTTRWSPRQALQHPFITNHPFRGPFQPTPDPHIPIRSTGFQPGSAPAGSPYGLAASPLSPEAHAQAHAAAMAAVNAHFSPRGQAFATSSALRCAVNEPPSPMSTSYHAQSYGLGTPNRRGGGIPTPPGQAEFAGGTPSSATMDAMQWNHLSPHYTSGAFPIGSVTSGSLMRAGSLTAVLAPWQQGGGAPVSNQPVGSLEALRSTWRAPHNSYQSGSGYGLLRSGRMGSGSIGSGNFSNLISPSSHPQHLDSSSLPPLPSTSLQSDLRFDTTGAAPAANDLPRQYLRKGSYDSAGPGSIGHASLPVPQPLSNPGVHDYAALLAAGGGLAGGRPAGFPPPSPPHIKSVQSGRRDDVSHALSSAFQNSGPSLLPPVGAGGPSSSRRPSMEMQSGWPKPHPGWQEQALQLQRLVRMASGESLPEPGDWDPLYSDDQLLSEEQALRRSDGQNLGQTAEISIPRTRPASNSMSFSDSQGGGRTGRPPASMARHIPHSQQQLDQHPASASLNALIAQQQLQGSTGRDSLQNQLDFRQQDPIFESQLRPVQSQAGVLSSQLSQSQGLLPGSYPGGIGTWQHPVMSASLYTLSEIPPYSDGGLGTASFQTQTDGSGTYTCP